MGNPLSIVWFRHDLRLTDNPTLRAAVDAGGPVLPVFIWAPDEEGDWPPGAASRWWLHQSLAGLSADLDRTGSRLILRSGASQSVLKDIIRESGAARVFWNRRYEPAIAERDKRIEEELRSAGIEARSFNGALLHEPWAVETKGGGPYQVFTAFWRACLAKEDPEKPLPAVRSLTAPGRWPDSESPASLELEPKIDWTAGMRGAWRPGEAGARTNLKWFLDSAFDSYDEERNRPDRRGTSRLSPHLHFGEISPRQVWHTVRTEAERRKLSRKDWVRSQFLAEIGWREFAHHLLYHFSHTPTKPLREEFEGFPWRKNREWLRAWQKGRTGYPIVDAGMRELWATGWMHNRVRMIVASFLVKDLLIHWSEGARWFWDTLVDADLANNTLGWQWTAGCGADAAPFFRVFNPVSQGEKFDSEGGYVSHWVPELARLPKKWIHKPWEAPEEALAKAGIVLGKDYPEPIVAHSIAREVALETWRKLRTQ